ncbi:PKS3 [Sanghuangporus weigelae]
MFLKMLPVVPGIFSWNRTHIKARALLDMLETTERYVHLVNPRPIPETALIAIFARKLCLPVVHIDDWMKALQQSYDDVIAVVPKVDGKPSRMLLRQTFENNPAARMLGFFWRVQGSCRGKPLRPDTTTACTPLVRCEKAVAASRTLRDPLLPQIGEEDVDGWLESWKTVGFLEHQVIGEVGIRSLL